MWIKYSSEKVGTKKMGMMRFWLRLLLLIVGVTILWQCLRFWRPFWLSDDPLKVNSGLDEHAELQKRLEMQKVTVAVYYEALCPDSRGFVLRQLEPTYQKIPDNVVVEMIPYGKATTKEGPNGYEFTCQHGPRECEANTIHACAIDYIKNPSVQLSFLACMIDRNIWPVNITRSCAEKYHIDAESILSCARTSKGSELLAKYGKMTHSLKIKDIFIPTVTLDGDIGHQGTILNNLLGQVCKHLKILPAECA